MFQNEHAVVWIDHHQARVIRFDREHSEESVIHPKHEVRHLHAKSGSRDGARAAEDPAFYGEIADALGEARTILVGGPANAKTEFVKHVHAHVPALAARIAGVEPMDHLSDGELLAEAHKFFRRADRA